MIVKLLVDAAPVLHRICVGLPLAMGAMTLRSAFCAALAATLAVACGGNVDAPAETTPRAVLVSAAKTQQAATVAQRLEALGVPLVWVVQP